MDVDRIATRLNPLVIRILRSPLHPLLSRGLLLLSYTGRQSGRRLTIPLGYQRDGDAITVLASRARRKLWWRNFRAPAPVELRVRGRVLQGEARVLPGDGVEFRAAVERTFRRLPRLAGQFGIAYEPGRGLTPEQWRRLAEEGAVVKIALYRDPR
jgi:deazaflavin-dependent oxidoreductase (nitroreductase family)